MEEQPPQDADRHDLDARRQRDRLIQRDNTYGTPEEDAFRRDFTVNALFYDIGTFSIIDYVGGLEDLHSRMIRCIGDPDVRFLEDPVRMLRAVVLAARLEFTIEDPILDSIDSHKHEIARSAPARLLEEYFKILRSGHAEEAFRQLHATGLLKEITPELDDAPDLLWRAISSLDRYRAQFEGAPDTLTNAILAGSLLQPLGLVGRRQRFSADPLERRIELGLLPIARRDVERLQQILAPAAPAARHPGAPSRPARPAPPLDFHEALTWLEIHGDRPEVVEHWRQLRGAGAEHASRPRVGRAGLAGSVSAPPPPPAPCRARPTSRRRNSARRELPISNGQLPRNSQPPTPNQLPTSRNGSNDLAVNWSLGVGSALELAVGSWELSRSV